MMNATPPATTPQQQEGATPAAAVAVNSGTTEEATGGLVSGFVAAVVRTFDNNGNGNGNGNTNGANANANATDSDVPTDTDGSIHTNFMDEFDLESPTVTGYSNRGHNDEQSLVSSNSSDDDDDGTMQKSMSRRISRRSSANNNNNNSNNNNTNADYDIVDDGVCVNENNNDGTNNLKNGGVPIIAVTLGLIIGSMIMSGIGAILQWNQALVLLVYGCISLVAIICVWILNSRRSTGNNYAAGAGGENIKRFPKDSYSIIALYGPKQSPDLFSFGVIVFLFQATLYSLMILSVIHPHLTTTAAVDNASTNTFGGFIPANAPPIVRATQIIAILSYMAFPDASLMHISKAVEMFPNLSRGNNNEKVWLMAGSCFLRFLQGMLGMLAVFFLVMTSSNVTEIVLNFTAVNFISLLDKTAFKVAKSGNYGPMLAEAANNVEKEPFPQSFNTKKGYLRDIISVSATIAVLFILFCFIFVSQESNKKWVTQTIRIQFEDSPELDVYNGCYEIDVDVIHNKRYNYKPYKAFPDGNQTQFGYCKEDRRWVLFNFGSSDVQPDDPCLARDDEVVGLSRKTDSFDISSSFSDHWLSGSSNERLDFLVDLEGDTRSCGAFIGDGSCDVSMNIAEFDYDGGDCCAATCTGSNCGEIVPGDVTTAFGVEIMSGIAYPNCVDPYMKQVHIELPFVTLMNENYAPTLEFECDGRTVFSIRVSQSMQFKSQTATVDRNGNCAFHLEKKKGFLWAIKYVVRTGDKQAVIHEGLASSVDEIEYFSAYHFYDTKSLPTNVDRLKDLLDLNVGNLGLTGTIPSEIGLLAKTTYLNLNDNYLTGTIPTEIGLLTGLNQLYLNNNSLTGTIPSEIGLLTALTEVVFGNNNLTGYLPSEMGQLTGIKNLILEGTQMGCPIPSEIGFTVTKGTGLFCTLPPTMAPTNPPPRQPGAFPPGVTGGFSNISPNDVGV